MAKVYDDFLRQRLSRRRLLGSAAGAAAGAAGLALVGCTSDDDEPSDGVTPGAEGTPIPGGIYKTRQDLALGNFSPFGLGLTALPQGLFVGFAIYDHLWYVPTDTGEVVPFLAEEIEPFEDGGQTVRVKMKQAFFHDKPPVNGRQVKSSDVHASVERFKEDPAIGFSWLREVYDNIETPDDLTVVYHQKKPWAWFFTSSNAGSPISSSIVPEEVLDNDEVLRNSPIGSGRWTLEGHTNFTNIKLRKFANWREPGLPLLDGADGVFITEDAQALAAFSAQQIDSIGLGGLGGLTSLERDQLQSRHGDQIVTSSDLDRAFRCLMLKFEEPFLDDRVRHAISLAINRQEIIDVLDLGSGELSGPVPPAHQTYALGPDDADFAEYVRHDPAEAKLLLEAANFPFDQQIDLQHSNFGTAPQLAQILGQQLQAVGLNVNVPPAEDLVTRWLTQTLTQGNFKMTSFTHLPYEDPYLPLAFYVGGGATSFMGYQDAEVDDAILASAEELDEERRIELTKAAQKLIISKWSPMLNLYSPIAYGARWAYVKGLIEGRGSFGLFNSGAWLDK